MRSPFCGEHEGLRHENVRGDTATHLPCADPWRRAACPGCAAPAGACSLSRPLVLAGWYPRSHTGNEACLKHAVLPGASSHVANGRQLGVQVRHSPASVPW